MFVILHGGTETSCLALFWPDNLPADADDSLKSEPNRFMDQMRSQGKLVRFPCEGKGTYSVALALYSEVPETIAANTQLIEEISALEIQGIGMFGGMEYIYKSDRSQLQLNPRMCQEVSLPTGKYSASVRQTTMTPELRHQWLSAYVGTDVNRLQDIKGILDATAVIGIPITLMAMYFWAFTVWAAIMLATSFIIGLTISLSQTKMYRRLAAGRREFAMVFPNYVVELDKIGDL